MAMFSVVIPTRSRPTELLRCLRSFLNMRPPAGGFELIVVDDGSEQPMAAHVSRFGELEELPLRWLRIEPSGPAQARNAGAEIATGEWLAFTDDDCTVASDWLVQFANGFKATQASALGGSWINPTPENIPAETWQRYMNFLRAEFVDVHGNALLLPSNNVAFQRAAFVEQGGFNGGFPLAAAEDVELSERMVANGHRQEIWPPAQVWHHHRQSVRGYLSQQYRYGRGAHYLHQARQHYNHKIERPPRRRGEFYIRLVRSFWQRSTPPLAWLLLLLTPPAHALGRRREALNPQPQPNQP